MEDLDKIDEVKEIELPKIRPCAVCGKKVESPGSDLVVCNQDCMNEWKRREDEKNQKKVESNQSQEAETPKEKKTKIVEIKKSTKIIYLICIGLFVTLILFNIFWFNSNLSNLSDNDFNSTIEVNTPITVNPPTVPITNNYQNSNPVNININLSDDIVHRIADEVIEIIINTNFTS